jgi:low temperature requirement protein LtrA
MDFNCSGAFVFFVARCAEVLAEHQSRHGALVFIGLLTIGWWAWTSTTLYANRFDTDDAVFRPLTLTAMAGVVAMAAAVDKVDGPIGRWFALGYVLIRVALIAGYVRAWRHVPDARSTARLYLIGHTLGAGVWLTSTAVPAPGRYWLWAVGVLVDVAWPTATTRLKDVVPLHVEHLPERFGLFVILVLGEAVAAVVTGLHDGGWQPAVVITAVPAFLVAAALWWVYFDLSGGAAKRRLTRESDDATKQAQLGGRVRGALIWPGAGVPLALMITVLDLAPVTTMGLLAAVLIAGVVTGFLLHRSGEVRTTKV